MTTFFDATDQAHLALMPSSSRKHTDLPAQAPLIEADVINAFTKALPSRAYTVLDPTQVLNAAMTGAAVTEPEAVQVGTSVRYVYLRGFNADPLLCEADLALALKRTIAEVLAWRLALLNREPGVTSAGDGIGKSRSYSTDVREPFPPNWDRWLTPFDTREQRFVY